MENITAKTYFDELVKMYRTPHEAEKWLDEHSHLLANKATTINEVKNEIEAVNVSFVINVVDTTFEDDKKQILKELDEFQKKYGEFINKVSPSCYRTTGHFYGELNQMLIAINGFKEGTKEELEKYNKFIEDNK